MVTRFAEMPREETTLLLMNRSPLQPSRLSFCFKACERIIKRTQQSTSDSLKAYMVTPVANMPREEITLAWSHYCSRIQHVTEAEGGFIRFFLYPLLFIIFM